MTNPPVADRQPRPVFQRIVIWSVLGIFVANLIKYYFFKAYPVYADEIAYRLMFARYFLDGHERISPWAACTSSYAIKLPFFMRMAAYALSPLAATIDFTIFRMVAIAILVLGIACLLLAGRRLKLPLRIPEVSAAFLLLAAFVMSIQTFSPTSIGLYIFRAEYVLLAAVPLLLFAISKEGYSAPTRWIWYAAAVVLFTLSAYLHPKTLFFTPFFAVFAWLLFRQSHVALRGLLMLPFVVIAKQCVDITNAQWLKCDEYPGLAFYNASFNINLFDLLKGKLDILQEIYYNSTLARLNDMLGNTLFHVKFKLRSPDLFPIMNRHSPWTLIGYPLANIFIVLCLILTLLGAATVIVCMARRGIKRTNGITTESAIIWLGGTGVLCTVLHILFNRARTFYDIATWTYLLTLFAAFGLLAIYSLRLKSGTGLGRAQPYQRRIYAGLALFLLFGNLWNALLLNEILYQPVIHGWVGEDEMPLLGSEDRDNEAQRVAALLPRCGAVDANSRFAVDYRAYPYLEHYPKPATVRWVQIAIDTAITATPWTGELYMPRCNRQDKNFEYDMNRTTALAVKEYPPQTPPTILWTPFEFDKSKKLWANQRNAERWEHMLTYMKEQRITAMVGTCPLFAGMPPYIRPIQEQGEHSWQQSFCCLPAQR